MIKDIQTGNLQGSKRLYSQRAIAIATYLGGPIAAGVLVRQNFIALGKEEYGMRTLFIAVVSTFLIFAGIFAMPEAIVDKIPNAVIPAIYTVIIYLVVEQFQGQQLKAHKKDNGEFHSAWKAAGVGVICMVFLLGGVFAYAYLSPQDFDAAQYDKGLAEFQKKEEEALVLFTLIENGETEKAGDFIQETGVPIWRNNMQVLTEMSRIEGLPQEFKDQNALLREYCELRIQSYQLIGKAITEDSDSYGKEIEGINKRIDEIVAKL